ncbi:putative interleukin-17 receptor E-like [Mugil cephalus]|uniref:putative interleukin-17 receptor E-like n=1 Tax=Mugil cephalus TaxID=48193 RepID=UPI001FB5A47C|nr:putative interleukin-17 receptor E-like [Mugil cephalus]XP_047431406.1 putative interleukin-17 receptor E-like [Mugil cephalus]
MVKMILLVALLVFHCCLGLKGAEAAESVGLEKMERCRTRCSQGLHCKPKPDYLFPPPCQNPPEGLNVSVLHNVSLSTAMRCEGRQKCSLHLSIKAALQLDKSINGLSICTSTAGMMTNCRILSFTKASRERMSGQQVEVDNNCTEVSPNQQVLITVKTVPSYCGITWTGTYHAPDCTTDALRRNVPECITGRLSYDVDPERKELRVNVSDMLEDHNYHLRLCHRDYICVGTGASTLIKKEEPIKSATLQYARPLPCLCIEGWSVVMDAPRVQVCPFKDRLEELWFGITFDPLEEALQWEPACPVSAVVTLCQKRQDGVCVDLPQASQNVSRDKITFAKVDPHPQLCMKFTVSSRSWTRCPFADGRFQAWEVALARSQAHEEVKMLSQVTATFSVGLCGKSEGSPACQTEDTHSMHVEKHKAVNLELPGILCDSCIQVKRLDVNYAATVIHCLGLCNESLTASSRIPRESSQDMTWIVVAASVCLSAVIIVTLGLHVLLTVHRRRKQRRDGACDLKKVPAADCAVAALETRPVLHRGVLIPDSPLCGNNEKANLISN